LRLGAIACCDGIVYDTALRYAKKNEFSLENQLPATNYNKKNWPEMITEFSEGAAIVHALRP